MRNDREYRELWFVMALMAVGALGFWWLVVYGAWCLITM